MLFRSVRESTLAKGLTAVSALRGRGDHSLALMISTPIANGKIEEARASLAKRKQALDEFATKFTALQ